MSRLYLPHKGLGLYSSKIPLLTKKLQNDDYYLFSAVGNYFMVFRYSDLAVIGTSDRLKETILSMASTDTVIFCGCESKIFAFKRAKHVFQKYSYEDKKNWKIVVVLGDDGYLCGVSDTNFLVIWDIMTSEIVYTSQLPENVFDICQVIQPKNYVNKVLIASKQGQMHLINYKTKTTLYMFTFDKSITILHQLPDNDTIAIGCADGSVLLHNVLYDKTMISVKHDLGSISSIAFREDLPKELIMLTGSVTGHVTMWGLEKGRNIGQTRDFHHGPVASLFCLPNKPFLVSNSGDNSIKVWNYDRPDGTPVQWNSRSGHWLPPSFIEYWPSGKLTTKIVSGGHDSVMNVFSTFEEKEHFSLGRAYLPNHGKREDKITREQYVLPSPRSISCNTVRDGFWDSVAVCHEGRRQVTTWTYSKKCRGKYYLDYTKFKEREFKYGGVSATSCAMSLCGNFVVVGYSSGHVVKYNIQSGQERGEFETEEGDGVSAVVVGLSGSRMVVVAVTVSGRVAMWDMSTRTLIHSLSLPSPGHLLTLHPNKDMVAVATKDGSVYLVQMNGLTVFQKVRGSANGPVTAVAFWHQAERMVVVDGTYVKTFDYIHQRLVDVFRVERAVTVVAVAPSDSVLVTGHEGELGLFLWALRTQSIDLKMHAVEDDSVVVLELPQVAACENCDLDDEDENTPREATVTKKETSTKRKNAAAAMTSFTSLPTSYLAAMANVDRLRVQSEMAARGAASSEAFFVPEIVETLEGVRWSDEANGAVAPFDRRQKKRPHDAKTDLVPLEDLRRLLGHANSDGDYDKCMTLLVNLPAAAVDEEVADLAADFHSGSSKYLSTFLAMITSQSRRGLRVDLCEMLLATFLRHHHDYCLSGGPSDENDRDQDDPLAMHTDIETGLASDKAHILSLVNDAMAACTGAQDSLVRDLIETEQMTLLAALKMH